MGKVYEKALTVGLVLGIFALSSPLICRSDCQKKDWWLVTGSLRSVSEVDLSGLSNLPNPVCCYKVNLRQSEFLILIHLSSHSTRLSLVHR